LYYLNHGVGKEKKTIIVIQSLHTFDALY